MAKIAIIGAGSVVFCQTFLNDMLATDVLNGSTYALMGPTMSKLKVVEEYAKKVIEKNQLSAKVYSTTDRREALRGADYVIVMLKIGGKEAISIDREIPLKYGVNQCIGDSLGPGGIFRALRTIPVMVELVRDMEELCPNALLLNYVNPMGMVCSAIGKTSDINFVGLCHGIQTTADLIAGYVGIKKEEMDYFCAGINHMAWFLKIERNGEDLYPVLREQIEKPEYYLSEKVRCEVMRQYGYFMTESTHHLSEYLPWFRRNKKVLETYCDQPRIRPAKEDNNGTPVQEGPANMNTDISALNFENGELEPRSVEYCSYIIEAMEKDQVFRFNGNVINKGFITNLTQNCCVEIPIFVDRMGLHPTYIGDLPLQLAALNQSNITVQELAVQAALTGDQELVFSAISMDPLTTSVLTLQEIRDMTAEMFEASKSFLPQFEGKTFRITKPVHIPKGTIGVETPLDPALAIVKKLEKLAQKK